MVSRDEHYAIDRRQPAESGTVLFFSSFVTETAVGAGRCRRSAWSFKRTRCPTTPGASNTQTGGGRAASRAPHDRDRGCDGGGGGGAAAAAAAAAAAVAAVAAAAVASVTGAGAAAAMTGAVGALENNPGSRSGYKPVSYFLKNDVGFADSLTESLKKKTLKKTNLDSHPHLVF